MRPQHQTLFGGVDAPDDQKGNCFAACVASILEVDLATLPNFCAWPGAEWFMRTQNYLAARFGLALVPLQERGDWSPVETLSIASGPGPRGHLHSCVYDGRGLVHDPHPSGGGLLAVKNHEFFIVVDAHRALSFGGNL